MSALTPGLKLGSYEIVSLIGAGGMGEVYRARDSKLKRDVAIKVLPQEFSRDEDRIHRFQREAEVLASLNHPHIAAIHHLEEFGESQLLVLELVEGETLAERIKQGALPLREALTIAEQIAEALEAAHEKGIIHRDLKPANIKVTPEGKVKILDFGLAKAYESEATNPSLSNSPTLSLAATNAGTIFGTAGYMAPEQVRGKPLDRRADIWAFGVVLWEMLSGQPLFKGEDTADTLAQVLTKQPDLSSVPVTVRKLLAECFQKDPKLRLRDIGDAKRLIGEPIAELAPSMRPRRTASAWAVAVLMAIVAAIAFWAPWRTAPRPTVQMRFQIPLPGGGRIRGNQFYPAISPDGRTVAFVLSNRDGIERVWIRDLNSLDARELPGTDPISTADAGLFWSPDSRWIAFASVDFKLKKVDVQGGPVQTVCDLSQNRGQTGTTNNFAGGTWGEDGTILLSRAGGGITRVPQTGGTAIPVTTVDRAKQEVDHIAPQFLPDGRFLYRLRSRKPENSGFYIGSLTQSESRRLLPASTIDTSDSETGFSYAPPAMSGERGHLLHVQQNILMAQPVDPFTFEPKGETFAVMQDVGIFSVSRNGVLAYGPSRNQTAADELRWIDRTGNLIRTLGSATDYSDVALSNDGKRVAVSRPEVTGTHDIWLFNTAGRAPSRFTFELTDDRFFRWSPDGNWLAYATGVGRGHDRIMRKNTTNIGTAEVLLSSGFDFTVQDWSRDRKYLLYSDRSADNGRDLWTLALDTKDAKPVPYLQTPTAESAARFSPDGRWVAYHSDELGRNEVFVQSFPVGNGKFQISTEGGGLPRWRADGRELFYIATDGQLMAAKTQTAPHFEVGAPQTLFQAASGSSENFYDVSPDGNEFLVITPLEDSGDVPPFTVVLNWQAGFNR